MPVSNESLDPVREIRGIQQDLAAQKIKLAADELAAQAKLDAFHKLQHPLNESLQARRQKYAIVRRIREIIVALTSDAEKLRMQLHNDICQRSPEGRAGILSTHERVFHTERTIDECKRSVDIVMDEIEDHVAEAKSYAAKNNLHAMLPDFGLEPD